MNQSPSQEATSFILPSPQPLTYPLREKRMGNHALIMIYRFTKFCDWRKNAKSQRNMGTTLVFVRPLYKNLTGIFEQWTQISGGSGTSCKQHILPFWH